MKRGNMEWEKKAGEEREGEEEKEDIWCKKLSEDMK